MAKPWHWADNRPDTTEEPGDRGAEAGVAVAEVEAGGGTQRRRKQNPSPPQRRQDQRQERQKVIDSGA